MFDDFRAMADGKAEIKLVGSFFRQEDGENFIINEPLDLRGGGGQHFVEVQRGVDLLADLREDGKRLGRDLEFRIESGRIHLNWNAFPSNPRNGSMPNARGEGHSRVGASTKTIHYSRQRMDA